VICDAPFIDDAVEDLTRPLMFRYATQTLPVQPKKRSVLKDGKRTLVKLDQPISRKHAQNALQILHAALELAVNEGLICENPLTGMWSSRLAALWLIQSTTSQRTKLICS
jgi:hypothetical protein